MLLFYFCVNLLEHGVSGDYDGPPSLYMTYILTIAWHVLAGYRFAVSLLYGILSMALVSRCVQISSVMKMMRIS